jgi:chromosome segregation ATPase
MAEIIEKNTGAPGAAPNNPGNPVGNTLFWVMVAALVVVIGVVYFIHDKNLTQTRDEFATQAKVNYQLQKKETDDALDKQKNAMMQEIATVTERNKKLEAANETLAKNLTDLSGVVRNFVEQEYKASKSQIEEKVASARGEIVKTNENVHNVEVSVKYLTDSVNGMKEKLNGLDGQIGGLKTSSEELRKEQAALQAEIKSVEGKSGITDTDLKNLTDRTRLFELKVMTERAKQAADAARNNDYQSLFDKLRFKD